MVGRLYGEPAALPEPAVTELLERFDLVDAARRADKDLLGWDAAATGPRGGACR